MGSEASLRTSANPLDQLERNERPQIEASDKRILSREELEQLFEAAGDRWELPLKVTAFCGLRAGETCGLRWEDIDWGKGTLAIRRQAIKVGNAEVGPLKTPASRRTVYVMPSLLQALRAHRLASRYSQDQDPIFTRDNGKHNPHISMQRGMDAAVKRAGLLKADKPKPTLHSLRHGFGSHLIAQGTDIAFVARQMGHSNPGITLKVYTHEWEHGESAAKATALMEETFSALV